MCLNKRLIALMFCDVKKKSTLLKSDLNQFLLKPTCTTNYPRKELFAASNKTYTNAALENEKYMIIFLSHWTSFQGQCCLQT